MAARRGVTSEQVVEAALAMLDETGRLEAVRESVRATAPCCDPRVAENSYRPLPAGYSVRLLLRRIPGQVARSFELPTPNSGVAVDDLIRIGKEEGVKLMGGRVVVHFQIVDEAFLRLEKVMDRVLAETKGGVTNETGCKR